MRALVCFGGFGLVDLVWWMLFGEFGLVDLVWWIWLGGFGLVDLGWLDGFGLLVDLILFSGFG